jgi:hypothetical protein
MGEDKWHTAVVENFIDFEILMYVSTKFKITTIDWQIKLLICVEYNGYKTCMYFLNED